ncbi:MAG: asparagine synthase (glutamine-hydrolyzing) [Planctomycetales bacterium]|nr:asparagine synthase (glutamine-hydrolyzing) [Planctomycetales bacterium]
MCGIAGIIAGKSFRKREILDAGVNAIAHRGPNGNGVFWSEDGRIGLAHTRLAIIDLSDAAKQPMLSKDGKHIITFNGEIYNYRRLRSELLTLGHSFSTSSDTEVLLNAYRQWGRKCVERIHGMFAFAIYDVVHNKVVCARDRAGEKPFYFFRDSATFRFASELKAMLVDNDVPRVLNLQALDYYLAYGYVPGEMCILDGFKKLPPAHTLEFDLSTNNYKLERYWQLPEFYDRHDSAESLESELEELLANAVRSQMVADVPVGLLLSGGVDSSLITAFAARTGERVQTYTVGFPEYPSHDERTYARIVSKAFQTNHEELIADVVNVDTLGVLAEQYDEPIVDSSMIPTFLVAKTIAQKCRVAIGGDGGDELFGGYHSASRVAWLSRWIAWIPRLPRKWISDFAKHSLRRTATFYNFFTQIDCDFSVALPEFMKKFDSFERKTLVRSLSQLSPSAESNWLKRIPVTNDCIQRITRFDFENFLPEDILVKVDRASMRNSLEVRAPFLDVPVIEFAYRRIPPNLKATTQHRKVLLKRIASRLLPKELNIERKQGFSIPLGAWLKDGMWRKFATDVLLSESCTFNHQIVEQIFKLHDQKPVLQEAIFSLLFFELWRRRYNVSVPF